MADAAQAALSIIGRFNDAMDQLNSERQLSNQERITVRNLEADSPVAHMYSNLRRTTEHVWQRALNCQRDRNSDLGIDQHVLEATTDDLFSLCRKLA